MSPNQVVTASTHVYWPSHKYELAERRRKKQLSRGGAARARRSISAGLAHKRLLSRRIRGIVDRPGGNQPIQARQRNLMSVLIQKSSIYATQSKLSYFLVLT